MKITVNGKICSTEEEIKKALEWENQKGEYAIIEYHETYPLYGNPRSNEPKKKLEYNGRIYNIPQNYTYRNWYNDNYECTTPYNDGRAFSEELSYKYNVKEILDIIYEDLKKIGVRLG